MRIVLVLIIGLAFGYYLGYQDGAAGKPSIGARVVERIGGNARRSVTNDIDAAMRQVEDSGKAGADKATKR